MATCIGIGVAAVVLGVGAGVAFNVLFSSTAPVMGFDGVGIGAVA